MNIIKQMFETPDTPSGKKRLNNLITRLGLGKKVKGDLMKDVVSGELGGGSNEVKEYKYYKVLVDLKDTNFMTTTQLVGMFTDIYTVVKAYNNTDTEFLYSYVSGWPIYNIFRININNEIIIPNGSDTRFYPVQKVSVKDLLQMMCSDNTITEITKEEYYSYDFIKYEDIE